MSDDDKVYRPELVSPFASAFPTASFPLPVEDTAFDEPERPDPPIAVVKGDPAGAPVEEGSIAATSQDRSSDGVKEPPAISAGNVAEPPTSGDSLFATPPDMVSRSEVSTKSVLIVEGKAHAVGLRWRVINDVSQAREGAQDAAEEGEDLFVATTTGEPSVGLASSANGHVRAMPVLAARLASAINGDWSGIFDVDDAFYVISVRGGVIDDRSDVAFLDKAGALRALSDVASGGTGRVLASAQLGPEVVGFAGVEVFDFRQMISGTAPQLQPIEGGRELPRGAVLGGGVAAVILAVWLFNPAGLYDKAKSYVGLGAKVEKQVVVIPPAPWAGQPKAPAMLRACVAAFRLVPSFIRSWRIDKVECNGREVSAIVARTGLVDQAAPPVTWLDDWVRNHGTLTSPLIKLERPTLSRTNQGIVSISWKLPPYRTTDRWREADRPGAIAAEQQRLWLEMERRYVPVNFVAGAGNQYFSSEQVNVVFDPFQVERVAEAMSQPVQVASRLIYDVGSRRVTASTRIFRYASPFPHGDDIDVVRQPSLAQVEGPNLPSPPP